MDSDKLTFDVLSNSQPGIYHQVVILAPKTKKSAGRSPLRRFRAGCTCDAVGPCCHVGLVYANFFC